MYATHNIALHEKLICRNEWDPKQHILRRGGSTSVQFSVKEYSSEWIRQFLVKLVRGYNVDFVSTDAWL